MQVIQLFHFVWSHLVVSFGGGQLLIILFTGHSVEDQLQVGQSWILEEPTFDYKTVTGFGESLHCRLET